MNRRGFFASLGALAVGMALDPERALWVPGRRTYFDLGAGRRDDFIEGIIRRGWCTYRLDFGPQAFEFDGVARRSGPNEIIVRPTGAVREVRAVGGEPTVEKEFGGSRQAASIFNLSKIVDEAGGLTSGDLSQMTGKLRAAFTPVAEVQGISLADLGAGSPDWSFERRLSGLRRGPDISFNVVWKP